MSRNRSTSARRAPAGRAAISVVITNYNYGSFLPEAIESVLGQTHPAAEVLVIDDASTDHSRQVIASYGARVKALYNERNVGVVESLQRAINTTTGEYLVRLDADDRMRADYLERSSTVLDRNPDATIVYSDLIIFGPLAGVLAERVGAEPITGCEDRFVWRFPDPTPDTVINIDKSNFIHSAAIYRRQDYEAVGGYKPCPGPEDQDLYSRMLSAGRKPLHLPEPLIEYRQHSAAQRSSILNIQFERDQLRSEITELRRQVAHYQQIRQLPVSRYLLLPVYRFYKRLRRRLPERQDDSAHSIGGTGSKCTTSSSRPPRKR